MKNEQVGLTEKRSGKRRFLPLIALIAGLCVPIYAYADQASCEAEGGNWTRQGRLQSYMCVTSYVDAGKQCTDGDQCQGDCVVEGNSGLQPGASAAGICQVDSNRFGCRTTVDDGKAGATLCID